MIELDEVDRKILALLRDNARAPYTRMADSLGLSEGTIRRRTQRLIESGIIKRFTIEAGGEMPKALVLTSASPSIPTSEIAEDISGIDGVHSIFEVAGPYDIALIVSREDITSINRCIDEIRTLKGVQQTNTLFVLKEWTRTS